jgi:hypothetical protein
MKTRMRCMVYPGQFSSEYAVVVENNVGQKYSLFAPRELVVCDQAPKKNEGQEGWLIVDVLQHGLNGVHLVKLPRSTLESGSFLTVSASQLQTTPSGTHMNIEQIQAAFQRAGYQWQENVFNDDGRAECFIKFTLDKNPLYFMDHRFGDFGWGRYNRLDAWRMAHERLQKELALQEAK